MWGRETPRPTSNPLLVVLTLQGVPSLRLLLLILLRIERVPPCPPPGARLGLQRRRAPVRLHPPRSQERLPPRVSSSRGRRITLVPLSPSSPSSAAAAAAPSLPQRFRNIRREMKLPSSPRPRPPGVAVCG